MFTNHLKEILDTMIKENEVSDQCYNSLSKLEPIERFKTELKVHRSELFIKEMIQINWANIETSFKKMNNHFDDFVKGYLQSNKIAIIRRSGKTKNTNNQKKIYYILEKL